MAVSVCIVNKFDGVLINLYAACYSDGLIIKCLTFAETCEHVMDFTRLRALGSLFSMLNQMVSQPP